MAARRPHKAEVGGSNPPPAIHHILRRFLWQKTNGIRLPVIAVLHVDTIPPKEKLVDVEDMHLLWAVIQSSIQKTIGVEIIKSEQIHTKKFPILFLFNFNFKEACMNYKFRCPNCKKRVKVSTHDAVKYCFKDKILLSFDCPKCEEEITGTMEHLRMPRRQTPRQASS